MDIARREGLELGPNRKMQELMVQRNDLVLKASEGMTDANRLEAQLSSTPCWERQVDRRIQNINSYYTHLITQVRL